MDQEPRRVRLHWAVLAEIHCGSLAFQGTLRRVHRSVYTQVFPDWFAKHTLTYWTEALSNWSKAGVEFSGIWLDVNEPASKCDGSW